MLREVEKSSQAKSQIRSEWAIQQFRNHLPWRVERVIALILMILLVGCGIAGVAWALSQSWTAFMVGIFFGGCAGIGISGLLQAAKDN